MDDRLPTLSSKEQKHPVVGKHVFFRKQGRTFPSWCPTENKVSHWQTSSLRNLWCEGEGAVCPKVWFIISDLESNVSFKILVFVFFQWTMVMVVRHLSGGDSPGCESWKWFSFSLSNKVSILYSLAETSLKCRLLTVVYISWRLVAPGVNPSRVRTGASRTVYERKCLVNTYRYRPNILTLRHPKVSDHYQLLDQCDVCSGKELVPGQ